jgi:hypothetical protein
MPGWVSFTPTIPTKVGQFSADVDSKQLFSVWQSLAKHVLAIPLDRPGS